MKTGKDLREKLKKRAEQVGRDIPALFLALRHKGTPLAAKLTAGLAVVYALSPVDLIPDFIPVLGYLDDLLLLPALVSLTVRLIPKDVMAQCREKAEGMWNGGRPKKWYYALPAAAVWGIAAFLIVKMIWF